MARALSALRLRVNLGVVAGLLPGCAATPVEAPPPAEMASTLRQCQTASCTEADRALQMGAAALEAQRWDAAAQHFVRAASLVPGAVAPLVDASIALSLAGDHDAALDYAKRAISADPASLHAGVTLADAYLGVGHRVEALEVAERVVDRHPEAAEAWFVLGRAYFALVRRSEALDAFDNALACDPSDLPALIGTQAVLALRDDDSDLESVEAALKVRAPNDPDVLGNLAAAAEVRGHKERAISLYRQAIEAAKNHPIAHYNLGRLLHAERGIEAARQHYQAFLRQAGPAHAFQARQIRELLAP